MKTILIIGLFVLLNGCGKEPNVTSVFKEFTLTPMQVEADGQSRLILKAVLKEGASTDRRNLVFSTTGGVFTESGAKKQVMKAEFVNKELVATATLRAPTQPGTIKVSVQPEFDSPVGEFLLTKEAVATISEPETIRLVPSASGIAANHLNEVFLVGHLRNSSGRFVSKETEVIFTDWINGVRAGGQFRAAQTLTDDSSRVTAYYSATQHPIGTAIRIEAEIKSAGKKGEIFLTINQ